MCDKKYKILRKIMRELSLEEEWLGKYSEADLVMAINIYAGELLKNYQNDKELYDIGIVHEQIADIYISLVYLSEQMHIDLVEVALQTMKKNKKLTIEK